MAGDDLVWQRTGLVCGGFGISFINDGGGDAQPLISDCFDDAEAVTAFKDRAPQEGPGGKFAALFLPVDHGSALYCTVC